MPTDIRHARRLMRRNEAIIHRRQPFTIRLTRASEHNVQEIEFKQDTGDRHIGISVCSEKHEFVSAQFEPLKDETERHNDRRKYRRTRRNRKTRYRAPRFNNRRRSEGWFAPSLEHKKDIHIRLFEMYHAVCPITRAVFEVGSFDTHAMQEYEQYGVVLTGTDYQRGPRYGEATLREAVLHQQNYICPLCRKTLIGQPVAIHHIGYRIGDRSNRLTNLLVIHKSEHTSANHQPGGKLYDLKPIHRTLREAAFMNTVRWAILDEIRENYPDAEVIHTYGAETKMHRQDLGIRKSHVNDAYAMGSFHPVHRCHTEYYQKRRRNSRILSKFYDSKYVDVRDGSVKKGAQLGCNRTDRSVPRSNPENLRMFRGQKKSKGRVSVRRKRYSIQPGDTLDYRGKRIRAKGVHCNGTRVLLENRKSVKFADITIVNYKRLKSLASCFTDEFLQSIPFSMNAEESASTGL